MRGGQESKLGMGSSSVSVLTLSYRHSASLVSDTGVYTVTLCVLIGQCVSVYVVSLLSVHTW